MERRLLAVMYVCSTLFFLVLLETNVSVASSLSYFVVFLYFILFFFLLLLLLHLEDEACWVG